MNKYQGLFILSSITQLSLSMNIAMIKDNTGAIGIVTNLNTVQQLKNLSSMFAQSTEQLLPYGYDVKTNLTKEQLNFLLQLAANKDNFLTAIYQNQISLAGITRPEVTALGLKENIQNIFNHLFVLQSQDNNYIPVTSSDLVFFSTLLDMATEYAESFVIPITTISSQTLSILINLVHNIELSNKKLPYLEWLRLKLVVMQKIPAGLSSAQLLSLLEAAHYLGANSYILQALYELYKMQFSPTKFVTEEAHHPYLIIIKNMLDLEYPSIESLLKTHATNFYLIETVTEPDTERTYKKLKIFGPQITRLHGIQLIPGINNCKAIDIRNTAITMIETNDFDTLNYIEELTFAFNKQLSAFGTNCLKITSLNRLIFMRNNFLLLTENIFQLPNLETAIFEYNNLKIIKANWAIGMQSLTILTLNEPNLQTIESGWLNGLSKLKNMTISATINPIIKNSIQISTNAKKIDLYQI